MGVERQASDLRFSRRAADRVRSPDTSRVDLSLSGQPASNQERGRIRPGPNFLPCLILNGMSYVDSVKIGTPQRSGLSPGCGLKNIRDHSYRRDTQSFQSDRVVHTARRA